MLNEKKAELKDKRIFIVEDNAANRTIMLMLFEYHEAKVAFEAWGNRAIERLLAFEPVDIILLDLMLPRGFSGYDIYDGIRSMPQFSKVPIVAVSATEPSVALPIVKAKGFSAFIPKPIDLEVLPTQIARIIAGESIWDAD